MAVFLAVFTTMWYAKEFFIVIFLRNTTGYVVQAQLQK